MWYVVSRLTAAALLGAVALLPNLAAGAVTVRVGAPDLSAGPKPSGGIATSTLVAVRKSLEEALAPSGATGEWSYFKGAGPAVNEALANRQLDLVYLGDLAAIIGRAGGIETRLLVPSRGNNAFLAVTPEANIKTIADLKGKRLAVFKGTAYQLSLDRALASAGLGEHDLQVINLDWSAAPAALAAKQIEATWAGVSLLALRDKGLAEIPFSTKSLSRELTIQSGLLGTQDFITAHPDLTAQVVKAMVQANYWASQPTNLEEFLSVTAEQSGIPITLAKAEFGNDDLKFRFSPRVDAFIVTSFQQSADQAKQLGLIRKDFDAKTWFEPRFVDESIASLGITGFWPLYDQHGVAQPESVQR